MGEVRAETVIQASPEAVWAALINVAEWASWNEVMLGGRCDGGLGARITCKVSVGPIWFPVDSKLLVWDEHKALAWGENRGRIVRINHGFTVEAVDGGTRVVHYERFEGAIGHLIFPVIQGSLCRNYQVFVDALKVRVEG